MVSSLLGTVLGGVLALSGGLVTWLWRDRRACRAAARLIFGELEYNGQLIHVYFDWKAFSALPFSHSTWESNGEALVRTADFEVARAVQYAYYRLNEVEVIKDMMLDSLKHNTTNLDLASEAIVTAMRALGPVARLSRGDVAASLRTVQKEPDAS